MSTLITKDDLAEDVSIDMGDVVSASGALTYIPKAIRRVNRRLHFCDTSNEITCDASGIITAPDCGVIDILILQTECMIAKTNQGEAVDKGIRIRSGQDEVDTTAAFGGYDSAVKNVCEELKDAIEDYLKEAEYGANTAANAGLIWYGEQRKYEDAEHDGQHYERKHPFDSMYDDETAHDLQEESTLIYFDPFIGMRM